MQVSLQAITRIEERLAFDFLLNSAIQRKAERVTAEEIRYMAQELETAQGGVYSILSQEMQLLLLIFLCKECQQVVRYQNFKRQSSSSNYNWY